VPVRFAAVRRTYGSRTAANVTLHELPRILDLPHSGMPSDAQELPMPTHPALRLHVAHGARMVDFAGWDMAGAVHRHRRRASGRPHAAGLFDISHMGRSPSAGPDGLALIQLVTPTTPPR